MPSNSTVRLAVAQLEVTAELPDADRLSAAGARIRAAMGEAASAGAHIVQFPEGALAYPSKRLMSSRSPDIAEADWTRVDWAALHHELQLIRQRAHELGIWTVVGAPHARSHSARPHNSMYVFSALGELVARYDKRRLSTTESTFMYTPGRRPVVFEVAGMRLGLTICLEVLFPELFVEYASIDVDAVLVSSAPDEKFGNLAQAHARSTGLTIGLCFATSADPRVRSGICCPTGWIARAADGGPEVIAADLSSQP